MKESPFELVSLNGLFVLEKSKEPKRPAELDRIPTHLIRTILTFVFMTKNLIRLALITIPIIIVIGLIRINFGIELTTDGKAFQGNYMAVGALTVMFSTSWLINIPLVRFFKKPFARYAVSYTLMSIFIWLLISFMGQNVFGDNYDFYIHPFWGGLIFNTIVLALTNFTILKTSRDIAELQLNELKRLQLEAEKKLLVQQLQPHFLFNALSTLKSLINEDQNKASDYTVQLSEFLRYTIASNKQDTVSVEGELNFTLDYIKLQSERFLDAVVSDVSLPEDVLQMKVPVFSLQTLVENAFKHNRLSSKEPLRIKIWFEENLIKVSNTKNNNNQPVVSTGTGLSNLNERYQIIAKSSIIIEDKKDTFTVSIKPIDI